MQLAVGFGTHHLDTDRPVVFYQDVGDLAVFKNKRPALFGTFGIGHRGVYGVGLPVIGRPKSPNHTLAREQRIFGQHIAGRQELNLDAKSAPHCPGALELFKAGLIQGNRHRAVLLEARSLPGLGF